MPEPATSNLIEWEPRYAVWIALQEDGETQAELAERLDWPTSKLSRIVTGKTKRVDISEWQAIAAAQGRKLDYYLTPPVEKESPIIHALLNGSFDLESHSETLPTFSEVA